MSVRVCMRVCVLHRVFLWGRIRLVGVVSYDRNECLKPDKEASNERIDGVAATVTALAVVIEQGGAPPLLTVA